jgi:TetR/AcrR family transcriptional repressor of nem operon
MSRPKQFDESEVLENAMRLFWKKGFHATSIQDLVDTLGVNRASLYGTYGGKEVLFRRSLDRYFELETSRINQILENETLAKSALSSLFDHLISQILSDTDQKGCLVINSIAELFPGEGALQNRLAEIKKAYESLFSNILFEGIENGEFSSEMNVPERAAFLFSVYTGLKVISKISPSESFLRNTVSTSLRVL